MLQGITAAYHPIEKENSKGTYICSPVLSPWLPSCRSAGVRASEASVRRRPSCPGREAPRGGGHPRPWRAAAPTPRPGVEDWAGDASAGSFLSAGKTAPPRPWVSQLRCVAGLGLFLRCSKECGRRGSRTCPTLRVSAREAEHDSPSLGFRVWFCFFSSVVQSLSRI